MENKSNERCLNCVYYHHGERNGFVGMCCIGTERKESTTYDSHCGRWLTNKKKYQTEFDEV